MTPGINAARKAAVPHTIHEYEHDPANENYGTEAAEKTGVAPARVFKTLVVAIDGKELVVGIVPVTAMLNMKLIARAAGGKKPEWLTNSWSNVLPAMSWVASARWARKKAENHYRRFGPGLRHHLCQRRAKRAGD